MVVNGRAPRFSDHATQRRIEMALTSTEVLETVADPEWMCPTQHQNRVMFKRGRLVVITDEDVTHIVTVLWAGKDSRDG